ncbi:hypothetical protein [Flavobacterium sp.]|jgi:hypothetical protein|uniref:hypothetical protein n=1 Tax=Flavobacterium sp. TaxID=239 RepID=UPI0037BED259
MKNLKLIPILLCIFMLNVASMCSSDDDNSSTNVSQTEVFNTVSSGTWRITLYNDSGTIKTSNFTGYNFTFSASGILTAANVANTYSGTWSISDSNSNDDTINDLNFNIAFSTPAIFVDLTDDWHIQSRTATKVEFIDVSGGNGGTDYLTFEKN